MRLLSLEFFKLRRKKMGLTLVLFALLEAAFCFWSLARISGKAAWIPSNAWNLLFYNYTMLDSLLLPLLTAVLASRICDLEHKGAALKQLLPDTSAARLYGAKYLCVVIYLVLTTFLHLAAILLTGLVLPFPMPLPTVQLINYAASLLLVSCMILSLQLWVSITVQNQMIALVLGLAMGGIGFLSLLFPESVSRLLLWSYYCRLSLFRPDFSSDQMQFYSVSVSWSGYLTIILASTALYVCGCFCFSKKEY